MNKIANTSIFYIFIIACLVGAITVARVLFSVGSGKTNIVNNASIMPANTITVGLCADYPPFEFKKQGELQGFDIDLAKALVNELGAVVEFVDMDFSGLIPALNTERIDMIISGMTITAERQQNVDFSQVYFEAMLDAISTQQNKLTAVKDLTGKKLGAQLGSTMEQYAKNIPGATVVTLATNHQLIQELKIGRIDAIICEHVQAIAFSKVNSTLYTHSLGTAHDGCAIALKKGSRLLAEVDAALARLKTRNQLSKLKHKWLDIPVT